MGKPEPEDQHKLYAVHTEHYILFGQTEYSVFNIELVEYPHRYRETSRIRRGLRSPPRKPL
jgi:hypothetical protein